MESKQIRVVGGDLRQRALAEALAGDGHRIYPFALGCEGETLEGMEEADCVILPLPALDRAGMIYAPLAAAPCPVEQVLDRMRPGQLLFAGMADGRLEQRAGERGLRLLDYYAREELALLNAVPTAEGAIRIAMEELPVTLQGCRTLVLGFGRLGKALALRLRALGAEVLVAARGHAGQAEAVCMSLEAVGVEELPRRLQGCELVINTVPRPLLGAAELSALKRGAVVIDLASRPGGVDAAAAEALGVRVRTAPGLPGREAPVTAGGYIRDAVYHMLEELEA